MWYYRAIGYLIYPQLWAIFRFTPEYVKNCSKLNFKPLYTNRSFDSKKAPFFSKESDKKVFDRSKPILDLDPLQGQGPKLKYFLCVKFLNRVVCPYEFWYKKLSFYVIVNIIMRLYKTYQWFFNDVLEW